MINDRLIKRKSRVVITAGMGGVDLPTRATSRGSSVIYAVGGGERVLLEFLSFFLFFTLTLQMLFL